MHCCRFRVFSIANKITYSSVNIEQAGDHPHINDGLLSSIINIK